MKKRERCIDGSDDDTPCNKLLKHTDDHNTQKQCSGCAITSDDMSTCECCSDNDYCNKCIHECVYCDTELCTACAVPPDWDEDAVICPDCKDRTTCSYCNTVRHEDYLYSTCCNSKICESCFCSASKGRCNDCREILCYDCFNDMHSGHCCNDMLCEDCYNNCFECSVCTLLICHNCDKEPPHEDICSNCYSVCQQELTETIQRKIKQCRSFHDIFIVMQ
jgi:hypothetical protein